MVGLVAVARAAVDLAAEDVGADLLAAMIAGAADRLVATIAEAAAAAEIRNPAPSAPAAMVSERKSGLRVSLEPPERGASIHRGSFPREMRWTRSSGQS